MEIYDKIESMFLDDSDTLDLILKELKEIKELLKNNQTKEEIQEEEDKGFQEFINRFKGEISEDELNGIFPEIEIDGYLLGYKDGVLYDKYTNEKFNEEETKELFNEVYRNYNISKKIEEMF